MTHAVIVADPNTDNKIGAIVSRHRSAMAAEAALAKLGGLDRRWAYVAARKSDGSYPTRCEG